LTAVITGLVVLILALPLALGGAWLAALGGQWAYLLLGIALAASAVLLMQRRRGALGVFALALACATAWSLWEAGTDVWALVPRVALLAVLALWLLTPWVARALPIERSGSLQVLHNGQRRERSRLMLALVLLVVCGVAALCWLRDPVRIDGALSIRPAEALPPAIPGPPPPADDWVAYGGNNMGQRYSALADITPQTVQRLRRAWTFQTGDRRTADDPTETTFQVTPLKVGSLLYLCTPSSKVFALDAATGREVWRYDPQVPREAVTPATQHKTCRGVGYHDAAAVATSAAAAATGVAGAASAAATGPAPPATPPPNTLNAEAGCQRRVLLATIDARLVALDAATGKPCATFGDRGTVDLKQQMPNLQPGSYMQTSPPLVTRELVIVGGAINDNVTIDNPSGVVRAFEVKTGRLVWAWHASQPERTEPPAPGALFPAGGPNMWSVASADEALGLVYLPMANRSPDLLGMDRSATVERYTSAVLALELATGRERWVFQTVRHDLWDRDVPAQPTLMDLTIGARRVPALLAPTKQGDIFVLDRRSGEPLVAVHERSVPTQGVAGEVPAPQQPGSALSFLPPPLRAADMWGATPLDQLWCRLQFQRLRYAGPYTPPTEQVSLVYPGNTGVFNWGGVAVDPVRELLVGSPVRLAFTHRLVPRTDPSAPLVTGDGREPFNENYGGRYAFDMGPFTSPLGLPCQAPPWGLLVGADLRSGKTVWQRRNGTVRDSLPALLPLPLPMGVPSLGGPLLTAGGVVFYSGTLDQFLRAYDARTGQLLWQQRLPFGGQATPMSYRVGGRQMVVVAAGGHGSLGTKTGDAVVAFVLE
jgi:quinoprotein glucose dehydrogenase